MSGRDDTIDAQTGFTEIIIQPDGRVYVQGLSRPVLDVVGALNPQDARLVQLLKRAAVVETASPRATSPAD
jgi:hypothetical protein